MRKIGKAFKPNWWKMVISLLISASIAYFISWGEICGGWSCYKIFYPGIAIIICIILFVAFYLIWSFIQWIVLKKKD
jgi:hypothetical protein